MPDVETHAIVEDVALVLGIAQQCVEVGFQCTALCASTEAVVTVNNDCNGGVVVPVSTVAGAVSGASAGGASSVSFGGLAIVVPTTSPTTTASTGSICNGYKTSRGRCKRISKANARTPGFPGCKWFRQRNPFYVRRISRMQCKQRRIATRYGCKLANNLRCPGGLTDKSCLNKKLGCQLTTSCPYKKQRDCLRYGTACTWTAGASVRKSKNGCVPTV